jgi:hypothetical protein
MTLGYVPASPQAPRLRPSPRSPLAEPFEESGKRSWLDPSPLGPGRSYSHGGWSLDNPKRSCYPYNLWLMTF